MIVLEGIEMKYISRLVFGFMLFMGNLNGQHELKTPLKERLPEWKMSVLERHLNGQDKIIEFSYVASGKDVAVKRYELSYDGELLMEQDVCELEKDGKKEIVSDGTCVLFYGKNMIKSVKEFSQGQLDGVVIDYFMDGKEEKVSHYKKGVLSGRYIEYYPSHEKKMEGYYLNGVYDKEVWTYYPSGKRKSKVTYENGYLEGEGISWYESGVIESYSQYKLGKLTDGKNKAAVVTYTEDGILHSVHHYKEGQKHGDHISYYTSGNKQIHQYFVDGNLSGKNIEYLETGEELGGGEFKDGYPSQTTYKIKITPQIIPTDNTLIHWIKKNHCIDQ